MWFTTRPRYEQSNSVTGDTDRVDLIERTENALMKAFKETEIEAS